MYKLIVDNIVVDVVSKLRYVRYIPELNKVVITTAASAHGICGSDNKTFYALPQVTVPQEKSYWKVATAVKICEKEYNELRSALKTQDAVVPDYVLDTVRTRKIAELSKSCNSTIISGFNCLLSDGKPHHFKLTVEDQLNLLDIQRQLDEGAKKIVFHATDEICQAYNREDIQTILKESAAHRRHQTTYFNILKNCIYNIYDVDVIRSINYGDDLNNLPVTLTVDNTVKELL